MYIHNRPVNHNSPYSVYIGCISLPSVLPPQTKESSKSTRPGGRPAGAEREMKVTEYTKISGNLSARVSQLVCDIIPGGWCQGFL